VSSVEESRIIRSVTLTVSEAEKIWKVCEELGYKQWSPCLRHLILKAISQGGSNV
jgi:hypothetical protein